MLKTLYVKHIIDLTCQATHIVWVRGRCQMVLGRCHKSWEGVIWFGEGVKCPIPAYSSIFQLIPAYFSLFQPIPAYSSIFVSLFRPIPAYSNLKHCPAIWSLVQPIPAKNKVFQPNPSYTRITDKSLFITSYHWNELLGYKRCASKKMVSIDLGKMSDGVFQPIPAYYSIFPHIQA